MYENPNDYVRQRNDHVNSQMVDMRNMLSHDMHADDCNIGTADTESTDIPVVSINKQNVMITSIESIHPTLKSPSEKTTSINDDAICRPKHIADADSNCKQAVSNAGKYIMSPKANL